ncbi:MAG: T9SS type A sorting domain-containing protein [Ignavibacteria bacterium]|nr:T9SS type A sorting domain-containing protein [Ignavibacteria bacterium]
MMKKIALQSILLCCISFSSYGQWQQCAGTAGLNMQSLLTNGNYNYAGGQTGTYLSIDSAANYSKSNSGNDAVGPTRGFTKDNTNIYTCTSQGAYRSSDNGASWVSKSSGLTNLLGSGILSVGSRLFYVGPTGVFMSTDQGDNWNAAGLPTTDIRCVAAIDDTLFVGTNGAGIYKSIDWGVNWVTVNNGLGGSVNFRALESKGSTLFAGGPTGTGVYRSTDYGANWTLLGGGLASGSYRGFASNSQLIVAGSFGGGVFYSTNNGDNWTTINTGLTDLTIFDLELNDSYIIAATNTQGVFRIALSNLNSSTGIADFDVTYAISLFPNPTTSHINLKADSKLIGTAYTLYEYLGKAVLWGTIDNESTFIEMENLPRGVYMLSIGDDKKQVLKLVKQ